MHLILSNRYLYCGMNDLGCFAQWTNSWFFICNLGSNQLNLAIEVDESLSRMFGSDCNVLVMHFLSCLRNALHLIL